MLTIDEVVDDEAAVGFAHLVEFKVTDQLAV